MSAQQFKSIYFSDHPSADTNKRNLKIAFGPRDAALHQALAPFSSCEIRSILGVHSLKELQTAARETALPLNTYCLQVLRKWNCVAERAAVQLELPTLGDLGLHSTFRAGRDAPLQRWYPWLEGYSPEFVRQILAEFAPRASRILDPFGGCGTTLTTTALMGKTAFYCELNPLLQFVVDAKVRALLMTDRERHSISSKLFHLADDLGSLIAKHPADTALRATYRMCFGDSDFFSRTTLEQVLRARRALDEMACHDPLLAQFATVAVVAALVPSSKLKRAGDLRFRRGREVRQVVAFGPEVSRQLRVIAEDIRDAAMASVAPVLVASDARALVNIPSLDCDAVVTSPPYLNGTNYFRNTKIELWFLRSLRASNDLSALRAMAVTAGINDVSRDKPTSTDVEVESLVSTLSKHAYDSRIPRMVGSYFHDMETVLRGLSGHMKHGSVLAMDIGDSTYAGERVPTDMLLTRIADRIGFKLRQTVVLRNRVSRDATALRQVLLVFDYKPRSVPAKKSLPSDWAKPWSAFKAALPHQRTPFAQRNWGHPLHSLCSYQGKMKPALAHFLVRSFVSKGSRMLDPFAGVGTIPFEAAIAGVEAFGFEISPAALPIASAKIGVFDRARAEAMLTRLADFLAAEKPSKDEMTKARTIRFNSSVPEYFHPDTLREVLLARRFFATHTPLDASEHLVFSSVLHVLHGNRPYALSRRSHPITPFSPTGAFEYKSLIESVSAKVEKGLEAALPTGFVPGSVMHCDATAWWPQEVRNLDAIITSPPFFASTRFYLANWMRLWFAGWERADFASKPRAFVDERQRQSFRVYEPIFRQARERLKPNGVFVLHLGRSKKCDMAAAIGEVARPWFRVADVFVESVEHCESHGIRDKGTVTDHQFLVLE